MVVKIVRPGVIPESRIFDAKCNRCGCSFTFSPPDATYVSDQRDGDCYTLPCPTCEKPVYRSTKP